MSEQPITRTEWLVTGEPSLSPDALIEYPSYRFVFGTPAESRGKDNTAEERARLFIDGILRHDPTGWGGTIRLQSRTVTETPWKNEEIAADATDQE